MEKVYSDSIRACNKHYGQPTKHPLAAAMQVKMKKATVIIQIILMICFTMKARSENRINITIDNQTMSATLVENEATKALTEKLSNGAITISMSNYGGFEKVGELPWTLPSSDTRITTKPGDIMLYVGNNIVIFYGENTWAYTPLGTLETTDPSEISKFVGSGSKEVTISLDNPSNIGDVYTDANTKEKVYALDGKEMQGRPLAPGLYIINNKKVIIK